MKIAFYQSKWLEINLNRVAARLNHPANKVADDTFYQHLYNELINNKFENITNEWTQKKLNLSNQIYTLLEKRNLDDKKILSIGCGLGIIEQPLIKKGLKIDLQECQNVSIRYLNPEILKKTNFIFSKDLKEIKDNSYDVIMSITSTYCLEDHNMAGLLNSAYRILKPQGIFIWYETVLSKNDILHHIKQLLKRRNPEGVLWGWKRSRKCLLKKATEAKFVLLDDYHFDSNNEIINPPMIFGFPLDADTNWQMLILQKND